ncbi:hypothetical protein HII36_06540 [Nonomuraea sp. NN258]|nr:hypothetical protein [Nonomuraea antri]NRQ31499.1 hypothetical protein [Nonomuraea antri]
MSWLALWFVEPAGHKSDGDLRPETEPVAIETLFRLIEEFFSRSDGG